jgi:hypothetical protein
MRLSLFTLLTVAAALLAAGCRGTQKPALAGVAPLPYQRQQAQVFDPYPQDDAGPVLSDVRPREFNQPSSEVKRAQQSPFARFPRFFGGQQ